MAFRPLVVVLVVALALPAAAGAPENEPYRNFADLDFHQRISYPMRTTSIDVVVLPAAINPIVVHTAVVERAVDVWGAAVQELGAPWLAEGVEIKRYSLAQWLNERRNETPDIVIATLDARYSAFGLSPMLNSCRHAGAGDVVLVEWHGYDSYSTVSDVECGAKSICFIQIAAAGAAATSQTHDWIYRATAHQFGHCLGLGHLGDVADFSARHPDGDVMLHKPGVTQANCVSNLNVRGLERIFAQALGRPESEWITRGYVHMAADEYVQANCVNSR